MSRSRSVSRLWLSLTLLVLPLLWAQASGGAPAPEDVVVGIYVDEGAHPTCVSYAIDMFEWMGFAHREVRARDVNLGLLVDLTAIYFPGGDSPPYIHRISHGGKAKLLKAVEAGLLYIGTCAGSMFAAEVQDWEGVRYVDGQLGVFRGDAVGPAPGISDQEWCYTMLSTNSSPAAGPDTPPEVEVLWFNSPCLEADPSAETQTLATYVEIGEPAIVAQRRGAGGSLLTGPHPEYADEHGWAFMLDCVLWTLGWMAEEAP